jgi:short-chain fatty acids transporter
LLKLGLALAQWSERWFPDPLVFAFLGVAVVFGGGVLAGERPYTLAIQAGANFWALVPFTMQMVMVIVGGHVVASTPLVSRFIRLAARMPKTPRSAVAFVAFFSMTSSLVSWGLSLVFSGLLVRELASRIKGLDYRSAGAAAYLGLGTVWALGLSSSAAMLMATKSAIPVSLFRVAGVIPLTQTIFTWQSAAMTAVLIAISVTVAWLSAPSEGNARTATDLGIDLSSRHAPLEARTKPGEWLEYSPILNVIVAAVLGVYLIDVMRTAPQGPLAALDLNTYNLIFITTGLLLHWSPKRFLLAVSESIPSAGGVLIQFPIYAMIFGMIAGTDLSGRIAGAFQTVATEKTFPLLVAAYSAILGIFIPSGGSKWIVEAPYVMQAAVASHAHLGWVVQIYNAAEALPNLINPFWMLPLLGILKIRARDIAGYGVLQLIAQLPAVFLLCWLLAGTFKFIPPIK